LAGIGEFLLHEIWQCGLGWILSKCFSSWAETNAYIGAMSTQPDRRRRPREKVRIDATVVLDDGLVRLPAVLKNASPLGAKIELPDRPELPERFYVLFGHRLELCRLVWREDDLIGLAYED
jgi:hypothetical protein